MIQSKSLEQLQPEVAKLLCVGDELVSIQGAPLSSCGDTFNDQLLFLRNCPRPVTLGFVPGSNFNN